MQNQVRSIPVTPELNSYYLKQLDLAAHRGWLIQEGLRLTGWEGVDGCCVWPDDPYRDEDHPIYDIRARGKVSEALDLIDEVEMAGKGWML